MAQQKIRIRLKGYDHQQVDKSARDIVETAQRTGATITGPVPLPTEKNVYCVIRSPFKDKDSREHFEVRTHKRLIDIHSPDAEDGRLADAARPAGRRRHRDQALRRMKGIIGKKLGMTQLFDEESGVVTPVTVIEAGPCPVVQVKTEETDGYEAVQLAFEPVAERKISKAELGHLKKGGVERAPAPGRVPRAVRARARRVGHRRGLRAGRHDQGLRDRRSARASPGRSSGTASTAARSRTARTTSASRARSARRRRRRASSRA